MCIQCFWYSVIGSHYSVGLVQTLFCTFSEWGGWIYLTLDMCFQSRKERHHLHMQVGMDTLKQSIYC